MAIKTSLRDFQEYLSGRLTGATHGHGTSSWLGVRAGDQNWLVDLSEGGEIVQALKLTPVPLTRPWFAGIANIRGSLYAVADFAVFCGGAATPQSSDSRLLLVGSKYGANAALLVNRMLGLKNPDQFTAVDGANPHPWESGRVVDNDGREWKKLNVRALLADPEFMEIGA